MANHLSSSTPGSHKIIVFIPLAVIVNHEHVYKKFPDDKYGLASCDASKIIH